MLRAAYAENARDMSPAELEVAFDFLDRHFVVINASADTGESMPPLDWVLEKARAAVVKCAARAREGEREGGRGGVAL